MNEQWIGLVSPQGMVEYCARFVLGEAVAEGLENGRTYTIQELVDLAGGAHFLRDSSCSMEKNIKKWRVVK